MCFSIGTSSTPQNKFKPVGPGLKGIGKRLNKELLLKMLSPAVKELWENNDPPFQDLKARYKAAKKKEMKKSQMVKNLAPRDGRKPPIRKIKILRFSVIKKSR